jgi:arylsulfatase A
VPGSAGILPGFPIRNAYREQAVSLRSQASRMTESFKSQTFAKRITQPLLIIAVITLFFTGCGPDSSGRKVKSAASPKPNIIMVLADDLGYGDLGSYGQTRIKTPELDRMAAEGIRYTDCYAGSSVCTPSRYSLMTGHHLGHGYIRANNPQVPLRPEDSTVAEVLKEAGYATAVIGKWGLGDSEGTGSPNRQGFDYSFGFLATRDAHSYYPTHLFRNEKQIEVPQGSYSDDLFLTEALDFIGRTSDKPFFLYLPVTIPHGPYEVPSDEPYQKEPWPQGAKNYAAMITRLDSNVGRLLGRLKELGIDENTVVFVSSDNGAPPGGFFNSNGPLSGVKRGLYEGGVRVPMIVRWPGTIAPGQVSSQVWAFWDFLPTVAEIGRAEFTAPIDGISILPSMLGTPQQEHPPLYWEFHEKNDKGVLQAVRMGSWKGIRHLRSGYFELYDLLSDMGEENNLASLHTKTVNEITEIMRATHTESSLWPDR